jgi:hypothetical protein
MIFKDRKQQLNTCGGVTSKVGKWAFGSNSECLSTNTTYIPQLEPYMYLLMNFHCSPLDLKDIFHKHREISILMMKKKQQG